MRKIISIVALLFAAGNLAAQNANWGWGLTATVVQNGSSITMSVFDPVLNQTKINNQSGVATYSNSEGIVAWVTSGSTVGAAIYDINDHQWVATTFSSNSGNVMSNTDGVVAWVSSSGTVGGAVYDPYNANWKFTTFNSNSGNQVINNDGTIAWVSDAGTVGGAIYDGELHQWVHTTFNSNSGNMIANEQGVISFVSGVGTVGGAIYDPGANNWKYTTFNSNSGNDVINRNGIIAFISDAGTVGGAVYNPNQQNWVYTTFNSNSTNANLDIVDGSIQWNSGTSFYRYGYNLNSQNWENNYNTFHCKFFISDDSGSQALITHFSCLTLGANTLSYAAGDGHTITRRKAWKQYNSPGNFEAVLTIFNNSQNSTCSGQVQVSGLGGLSETAAEMGLNVFPNPLAGDAQLTFEAAENLSEIQLYNSLGMLVYSETGLHTNSKTLNCEGLNAGIYWGIIRSENGRTGNVKILIEKF